MRCKLSREKLLPSGQEKELTQPTAIIFDFDFTLADSSSAIVDCIGRALQELGFPIPPAERMIDTIGLSLAETFSRLTGQDSRQHAAHFTRQFHLRADLVMDSLTMIYEYVPPMLAVLHSCNIRAGVVSTKLHYRIWNILQRNNLADLFEVIVGADDVSKSKPDPEGLLLALKTLGAASSSALYVGDHIVDAEAAQAAGVPFVAVLSGRHQRNQFDQVHHLAILETVQQIPAFLRLHKIREASSMRN